MSTDQANKGKGFEELIEAANAVYEKQGIAAIQKLATPMKVVRYFDNVAQKSKIRSAFFEKKSTIDFLGTIKGGIPIAFDAKSTMNKTMFRIDTLEQHQFDYLVNFKAMGGKAFVIVEFSLLREIYRIDIGTIKAYRTDGKKAIYLADIKKECQRCSQAGVNPLHYLINLI